MPDWNAFYAEREIDESAQPAQVLLQNRRLLNPQKNNSRALDFACGFAANGRYLASLGYQTSGWDYAATAVEKLNAYSHQHQLSFQAFQHDLENAPLPDEAFDVIVVNAFLNRDLCPAISGLLKPDGLLFYQTFSGERRNEQGPSNPAYRLKPGELLTLFPELQPVYYREDGDHAQGEDALPDQAMLVAAR